VITARARIAGRRLIVTMLVAAAVAPVFNVLTSRASIGEALQGLLDAVLISVLVGGYFMLVRDGWARAWFHRLTFLADVALSSAIVLALFLTGRALGQVITQRDPARFVRSFTDAHLVYAVPFFVVFSVAVLVFVQMNRMVGVNVVGYFAAGVYHRPKAEERIFLFLDLVGSTQLAERLGSARYFELLRRFVDELTEPVLETGGEIYQYAGDEVVITWRMDRGLRRAACIRCFFAARDAVAQRRARYERDFGTAPAFRGGLHGGPVTGGEIGDLRRQIVFVGDILNTAARLEEYAKRMGFDLVVSGTLLGRLTLPQGIAATPCGELPLRGKAAPVAAYGLSVTA
jgi:adenylate cyclase